MLKSKSSRIIIALGLVGFIVVAGLGYAFLRPTEEATEPISAIPIAATEEPFVEPDYSFDTDTEGEPTIAVTAEEISTAGGVVLFEIVQAESQVRFTLGEILRGQPNTVVGTTDQVAGQIAIDLNNPATTTVGTILINARALATDSGIRDRAIKNQILDTNTYEFITFVPTSISGLPATVVLGETFNLEITGELTIRDITQQVTFKVAMVVVSETRLEGSGRATVLRVEYDLVIPNVQSVAEVDETVVIEIEFVAVAVE